MTYEVLIVGAGPAGSAAAITLARAGRRVLMIDKARFPRDKCCGDGLTAAALRELEALGLDPGSIPDWQPVSEVRVRGPAGRCVTFPLPATGLFSVVAPRQQLDAALVDVARRCGAEVADGHGLIGVFDGDGSPSPNDGGDRHGTGGSHAEGNTAPASSQRLAVEVAGRGVVEASFAIGADGAWSPLRKAIGAQAEGYRGDWHAYRQYFNGVGPQARHQWVWFEADLLPGYAWSFPLPGGRANVGFGVARQGGRVAVGDMGRVWEDLLARPEVARILGPAARAEGAPRAWPIPAGIGRLSLSAAGGRVLFVGDAAAATDPMTGEGIAQALLTGRLAAEAIIAGAASDPEAVARRYQIRAMAALSADHRLAAHLSRALAHRKGVRIPLRLAGSTPWTRRQFGRWLFEDYPRALILTPRRWRRGTLSRSGAYRTVTS
ncbi:MAG: NAD(P)/FAD-dependent oxidoreductase [Acidimicrobiales bacterium]